MKKLSRQDREKDVLLGLIDLYVKQGKPIGSHTLQEEGFEHLSSATIRNYFARLEMEGYLKQHHTSGGRAPTDKGYRLYAEEELIKNISYKEEVAFLTNLLRKETKAIPLYLQEAAHALSELSGCAVFLTAPRFDQDFIIKIQLMQIDETRILCALLTDFGQVHTEIIQLTQKTSLKRLEEYFHYRLTGQGKSPLTGADESLAKNYYNEIVLRHFVSYSNMHAEDLYKTGFSKLLFYPEFHDPIILSNTLSLFENSKKIKPLLQTTFEKGEIQFWIGDDLREFIAHSISLITIPYRIGHNTVGVIAILGPDRISYGKLFSLLRTASHLISDTLTKSLYKFKLNYRQPKSKALEMGSEVLGLTHENRNG